MNDFLIKLQAELDEASKGKITSEIQALQKKIDKLKLEAEIDPKVLGNLSKEIEDAVGVKIDGSDIIDTNSIGKAGAEAGKEFGQQLRSNINAQIKGIDNEISNTIKNFTKNSKLKVNDIIGDYNLNRRSLSPDVASDAKLLIQNINSTSNDILKGANLDSSWKNILDYVKQLHDIIVQYGKIGTEKVYGKDADGLQNSLEYFNNRRFYIPKEEKSDVETTLRTTLQALNREFRGQHISFTTKHTKGVSDIDSTWDEALHQGLATDDDIIYATKIENLINLLRTAKSTRYGKDSLLPIDEQGIDDYFNDYINLVDQTANKIQNLRNEQIQLDAELQKVNPDKPSKSIGKNTAEKNALSRYNKITGEKANDIFRDNLSDALGSFEGRDSLLASFNNAVNNTYDVTKLNELVSVLNECKQGYVSASEASQNFAKIVQSQFKTSIPEAEKFDTTAIDLVNTLSKFEPSLTEISSDSNLDWYKSLEPNDLFNWITENGTDAEKKLFGVSDGFDNFKKTLEAFSESYDFIDYDSFSWDIDGIKSAFVDVNKMASFVEQQERMASVSVQAAEETNTFRNALMNLYDIKPSEDGGLSVSLEQLEQVVDQFPQAQKYIDEIKQKTSFQGRSWKEPDYDSILLKDASQSADQSADAVVNAEQAKQDAYQKTADVQQQATQAQQQATQAQQQATQQATQAAEEQTKAVDKAAQATKEQVQSSQEQSQALKNQAEVAKQSAQDQQEAIQDQIKAQEELANIQENVQEKENAPDAKEQSAQEQLDSIQEKVRLAQEQADAQVKTAEENARIAQQQADAEIQDAQNRVKDAQQQADAQIKAEEAKVKAAQQQAQQAIQQAQQQAQQAQKQAQQQQQAAQQAAQQAIQQAQQQVKHAQQQAQQQQQQYQQQQNKAQQQQQQQKQTIDKDTRFVDTSFVRKPQTVSNDTAREESEYYADLLRNENAVVSVMEDFDSSQQLKYFSINIKRAKGEVESLRFALQEIHDLAGNVTGNEFAFNGSDINNAGAIKQIQNIDNAYSAYTQKLAQFKSVNSGILSGLTQPLSNFETKLQGLKNGTSTISEMKNAFNDLGTAASSITHSLDRKLNPIDAAVSKIGKGEQTIAGLKAEFKGLANAPKDVNTELTKCSNLLKNVKDIESKQGRTTAWAQAYNEFSKKLDEVTAKIKTLKKEEANDASSQVYQIADLKASKTPYMSKVYNSIDGQMKNINRMAKGLNLEVVKVDGYEKINGQISKITLTVKDAQGAIKQFNMELAKMQGNGKVQNGLMQVGDVKVIKTAAQAQKEQAAEYSKQVKDAYADVQKINQEIAKLDSTKNSEQILSLTQDLTTATEKYDAKLAEATQNQYFDNSAWDQEKAAIDANTESVIRNNEAKKQDALNVVIGQQTQDLDTLKSQWEQQGILVGDFANKVAELEVNLSNIQTPDDLEKFKLDLQNLSKEATSLGKINISLENGKLKSDLEAVNTGMRNLSTASDDLKRNVTALNDAFRIMSSPDATVEQKVNAYKSFSSLLPGVKKQIQDVARAEKTLETSKALSNQMEAWLNSSKAAKQYEQTIRELQSQLKGNTDKTLESNIRAQFRTIQSEVKASGTSLSSFVKSLKDSFLQATGLASGVMVFNKAMQELREGVQFAVDLDSALTNINYTMDVTASQLEKVGTSSIQMAKDLNTSTENVLQAVTLYANARETTESILQKAEPAIMLSNVTGFSGEQSAKYLQTMMNQFNLTQDDLLSISDTVQTVSQNIAHDFSDGIVQINEGIATSGEVARTAGLSLADYASMIGMLVERTGLEGSQLGNSLKTIITRTTKASKVLGIDEGTISDAEKALQGVGVAVRETDGEFRDFEDTMGDLAQVWGNLSDVERANISFALAGTRQINVLNSLLGNWDMYKNLAEQANNASGVTFENQEKYAASLEGKMSKLSTTMQSAWHNIVNEDQVSTVVDGLQQLANVIDLITGKLGLFNTTALGIGGILGAKNLGQ